MPLFYMGIYQNESEKPIELVAASDLSSYNFFTRGTVSEGLSFAADTIAKRTRPGQRLKVEEDKIGEYACYIYKKKTIHAYGRGEGICGLIISDEKYPELVAQSILSKICDEFLAKYPRTAVLQATANSLTFPELKGYLEKYQNPAEADNIAKIERELQETKIILHKTIESVLERGEKIDSLVAKSDGLSASSKMFYTQAKKQNSCCVVM